MTQRPSSISILPDAHSSRRWTISLRGRTELCYPRVRFQLSGRVRWHSSRCNYSWSDCGDTRRNGSRLQPDVVERDARFVSNVINMPFVTCLDPITRVWISSEDAAAVAEKGFRIIHAPSNYFYLVSPCVLYRRMISTLYQDCGAGEWISDDPTGSVFKTMIYQMPILVTLHVCDTVTAGATRSRLGNIRTLLTPSRISLLNRRSSF